MMSLDQAGPATLQSPKRPQDPLLKSFESLTGRIGVFGGTFDPLHKGHLLAARAAKDLLELDAVVFIPATQNPLKGEEPGASGPDRLEMLRRALLDESNFFVSDIELQRGGRSFTTSTLKAIIRQTKGAARIFLLVGADVMGSLPRWHAANELSRLADVVILGRDGIAHHDFESRRVEVNSAVPIKSDNFVSLSGPNISSTEIRQLVRSGEAPQGSLPVAVAEYINARGLYRLS